MQKSNKASRVRLLAAFATLAVVGQASAAATSISSIITTVSEQATSVITEALPFLGLVLAGGVLFKLIRKFVKP